MVKPSQAHTQRTHTDSHTLPRSLIHTEDTHVLSQSQPGNGFYSYMRTQEIQTGRQTVIWLLQKSLCH